MKKVDVCFIAAKLKKDYTFDAIEEAGFDIIIPYKDKNLFFRLIREFWFRLKLPCRTFFYNKKAINHQKKMFIVYDPLITPGFLSWLKNNNPEAKIYLQYVNRADTTINPSVVPNGIELVSYDKLDCEKYNMSFIAPCYFDVYSFDGDKYEKYYDVLFLGRDKGRLEKILNIEKEINELSYKTYFHICADRKFMRYKNKNYKRVLDYDEYLELLKHSKALINIARDDQDAVTQRELECIFDGVKCITTYRNIIYFPLYDKSRFFVLKNDNLDGLDEFLKTPFKPISKEELDPYRFEINMKKKYMIE